MHAWMYGRAGEWADRHPVYMNGWMEPLTLENSRICRKEKKSQMYTLHIQLLKHQL